MKLDGSIADLIVFSVSAFIVHTENKVYRGSRRNPSTQFKYTILIYSEGVCAKSALDSLYLRLDQKLCLAPSKHSLITPI